MDKEIENDFGLLDYVLQNIGEKYEESKYFYEENLKKRYGYLDFSTNIKNDGIEIYYLNSQIIDNEIYVIKYSYLKTDSISEWKFETKIISDNIFKSSLEKYNDIIKKIFSLDKIELMRRTKEKRPSNVRRRGMPEKFHLDFDKIKENIYQKYFSLKNKNITISNLSEIKYNISSNLTQFFFIKDLYLNERKIGEIIINLNSKILEEKELNFEIEYDKNKISISEQDNQYLLRNNYFMSNIFPNFNKILINNNDLIYNYYLKNLLTFSREKLDLIKIRNCYDDSVAAGCKQAKSIISEEVR